MSSLQNNRTVKILNAAAAGKYGVMAAIAYGRIPKTYSDTQTSNTHTATTSNSSLPSWPLQNPAAHR